MVFPFPIDGTIPAANNDPADDQPIMQDNFANTKGFLTVDHIAPGTNSSPNFAGFHKQVTYSSSFLPAAPVNPRGISFTANSASADPLFTGHTTNSASPVVQNFFRNSNNIFPMTAVRAFGLLQLNTSPVEPGFLTILNGFNIHSFQTGGVIGVAGKDFIVRIVTNSVVGDNVAVFLQMQNTTVTPRNIATMSFTNPDLRFSLDGAVAGVRLMSVLFVQI